MYETINPNNVVMYAIRHYSNPQCEGEKEFEDDLEYAKAIKDSVFYSELHKLDEKIQEVSKLVDNNKD